MFLTREEVIIHKLKKFGEALVGGILFALPIVFLMFLGALIC